MAICINVTTDEAIDSNMAKFSLRSQVSASDKTPSSVGTQPSRYHQRIVPVLVALWPGLAACGILALIAGLGGWPFWENQAQLWLFRGREWFEPATQTDWDDRVVVLAIDEASLELYGQFPWSRDRYADLLDTLSFAQPAVVAFDILFAESTPADEQFGAAIAFSNNVVRAVGDDGQGNALQVAPTLVEAAAAAYETGHVKAYIDADGIGRSAWLYENQFPALGVAAVDLYNRTQAATIRPENAPEFTPIPLPDAATTNRRWLNWPESITVADRDQPLTYAIATVMEPTFDLSVLQNKIILIGTTAIGLDPLRSPFDLNPPIAGVYLHATVVDNILNQRFLRRSPPWVTGLTWVGMAGLTLLILAKSNLWRWMLVIVGLPLGWIAIAIVALTQNWWISVITPILAVWLTLGGQRLREYRERRQLMDLFALHVAPEMAKVLWQQRQAILQGGEVVAREMTATVLFMDIRGFTSISEQLTSPELLAWLNRYLDVMTDCIMAHDGVVDKYIGDAIMAVFGVPFPRQSEAEIQQDVQRAIAACIAMHGHLDRLNDQYRATGQPEIQFGIGLHTGIVTAGSVGGHQRLNYSIVGDTVNVAARLESMTKTLTVNCPFKLLITADTYAYVQAVYPGEVVDTVTLRGRVQPTEVYTLRSQ